jgi:hypothetical protein
MAFTTFMNGTAGRALRIIAGVALIAVGLAVVGGTGGVIIAVVGLVPIGAGVGKVCLLGPVLGTDLHGNPKSA